MEKQHANQISSSLPSVFSPILLRFELKGPNKKRHHCTIIPESQGNLAPCLQITGMWEYGNVSLPMPSSHSTKAVTLPFVSESVGFSAGKLLEQVPSC